jgi:hypothetical protein
MKNKKTAETPDPLIPLQIKLREETREKLKTIAARNGLSLNDVASMAVAAGLNMVDGKLREIHEPEKQAA